MADKATEAFLALRLNRKVKGLLMRLIAGHMLGSHVELYNEAVRGFVLKLYAGSMPVKKVAKGWPTANLVSVFRMSVPMDYSEDVTLIATGQNVQALLWNDEALNAMTADVFHEGGALSFTDEVPVDVDVPVFDGRYYCNENEDSVAVYDASSKVGVDAVQAYWDELDTAKWAIVGALHELELNLSRLFPSCRTVKALCDKVPEALEAFLELPQESRNGIVRNFGPPSKMEIPFNRTNIDYAVGQALKKVADIGPLPFKSTPGG